MKVRTVLTAFTVLLGLQFLNVAAEEAASESDSAWISFCETTRNTAEPLEFHARATRNVDPKLLQVFSGHVSRATDRRFLLESYTDARLEFRSDNFLVTKIDDSNVTLAAGKEFSTSVTRKLTKRLQQLGFHVDSVAPETLLQRNDSKQQGEPEFVVPFDDGLKK